MAVPSGGKLNKLTIEGFKDANCQESTNAKYTAQLNPDNIKINYSIEYVQSDGADADSKDLKPKGENSQTLTFSLIIDGTGVLAPLNGATGGQAQSKDVDTQIEELKEACYYYIGDTHEQTYCKITWNKELLHYRGTSFAGRLKSLDITYTLFSSSGAPLRAKVALSFLGTTSGETNNKVLDKKSPDLTHIITIKTGDNLPMLCQNIYGDATLYSEIARINNIVNFRYLEPGSELVFPPIK